MVNKRETKQVSSHCNFSTKNHKAQMKIQQMAFMLIAIMVFFSLVGLLVVSVKFSGMKEKATELQQENAMLLATKLSNSPEFSCGNAFSGSKVSCIDSDKVMALKKNVEDYKGFWGDVVNIEIRKIYPVEDKKLCTPENYPDCNIIRVITKEDIGVPYGNFVVSCRKVYYDSQFYDECELAKLRIFYENVQ